MWLGASWPSATLSTQTYGAPLLGVGQGAFRPGPHHSTPPLLSRCHCSGSGSSTPISSAKPKPSFANKYSSMSDNPEAEVDYGTDRPPRLVCHRDDS